MATPVSEKNLCESSGDSMKINNPEICVDSGDTSRCIIRLSVPMKWSEDEATDYESDITEEDSLSDDTSDINRSLAFDKLTLETSDNEDSSQLSSSYYYHPGDKKFNESLDDSWGGLPDIPGFSVMVEDEDDDSDDDSDDENDDSDDDTLSDCDEDRTGKMAVDKANNFPPGFLQRNQNSTQDPLEFLQSKYGRGYIERLDLRKHSHFWYELLGLKNIKGIRHKPSKDQTQESPMEADGTGVVPEENLGELSNKYGPAFTRVFCRPDTWLVPEEETEHFFFFDAKAFVPEELAFPLYYAMLGWGNWGPFKMTVQQAEGFVLKTLELIRLRKDKVSFKKFNRLLSGVNKNRLQKAIVMLIAAHSPIVLGPNIFELVRYIPRRYGLSWNYFLKKVKRYIMTPKERVGFFETGKQAKLQKVNKKLIGTINRVAMSKTGGASEIGRMAWDNVLHPTMEGIRRCYPTEKYII